MARLVLVAAQAARRPAGKVTEVFGNDADRQGAYGLLESQEVTGGQVGALSRHAQSAAPVKSSCTARWMAAA